LFLITLFISAGILGEKLAQWGPYPPLLEDVRLVEGISGVQAAGMQDWNTISSALWGRRRLLSSTSIERENPLAESLA
jgi:hypothetical protein